MDGVIGGVVGVSVGWDKAVDPERLGRDPTGGVVGFFEEQNEAVDPDKALGAMVDDLSSRK